jgi:hypothetical protein
MNKYIRMYKYKQKKKPEKLAAREPPPELRACRKHTYSGNPSSIERPPQA